MAKKILPFNFFDDAETKDFFKDLNPKIQMPSRSVAQRKTVEEFERIKENVKLMLKANTSKVSFTMDGYTSINSKSYYGLTVHFVGSNWKLHSLALDFIPSNGSHTGKAIADMFFKSITEFDLEEKIQGITLNNVAANSTFINELGKLIKEAGYKIDTVNQHFRCFSHILNLGVQDILKMLNVTENDAKDENVRQEENNESLAESNEVDFSLDNEEIQDASELPYPAAAISKVSKTFVKLRRSEDLQLILQSFCTASKIKYIKTILDVSTRWNSTDNMLEVAIKMRLALDLFWKNCDKVAEYKLSADEWSHLTQIQNFLIDFKKVSTILGGDRYVTLPLVIVAFNLLVTKIEKTIFDLDDKSDRNEVDEILLLAFQAGRDKMIKHDHKTNWLYCSSLILDPRFEVGTFALSDWGREIENSSMNLFKNIYYKEYSHPNEVENELVIINNDSNTSRSVNENGDDNLLDLNSLYENSSEKSSLQDEFQSYLALKRSDKNQNILDWWKDHEKMFPTLAKMARDIFSITATSVPVERLFSLAKLIVTRLRNSLKNESIRSTLCLNSWASSDLKAELGII